MSETISPANVASTTLAAAVTAPAQPKESILEKFEAGAKKVWSVIETIGKDADKGLTIVETYLPEAASLAAVFFPAEKATLTGVVTAVSLIQKAVADIKQKSALLPAGLTSEQMVAQELALVGPEVTSLLTAEGISADTTLITKIINGIVAILNARQVTTGA